MAFVTGEQRQKFEGNRGTKTILWNREHKKTNFQFLGNRGKSQYFFSQITEKTLITQRKKRKDIDKAKLHASR